MHHEDYELAKTIHSELTELMARAPSVTWEEIQRIADKAARTNLTPTAGRVDISNARENAWLAVNRLAEVKQNGTPDQDAAWTLAIDKTRS